MQRGKQQNAKRKLRERKEEARRMQSGNYIGEGKEEIERMQRGSQQKAIRKLRKCKMEARRMLRGSQEKQRVNLENVKSKQAKSKLGECKKETRQGVNLENVKSKLGKE